jgi:hypothetical protein
MDKASKLGYAFLFLGAAIPYLIEHLLGPGAALAGSIACGVVGIGFLFSAHVHREITDAPITTKQKLLTVGLGIAVIFGVCFAGWKLYSKTTTVASHQPVPAPTPMTNVPVTGLPPKPGPATASPSTPAPTTRKGRLVPTKQNPTAPVPVVTPTPATPPTNQQACAPGAICNQNSPVQAPQTINNGPPPPEIVDLNVQQIPAIPAFQLPADLSQRETLAEQYNMSLGFEKPNEQFTVNPGLVIRFRVSSDFVNPKFHIDCGRCISTSISYGASGPGYSFSTPGLPPILSTDMQVVVTVRSPDETPLTGAQVRVGNKKK